MTQLPQENMSLFPALPTQRALPIVLAPEPTNIAPETLLKSATFPLAAQPIILIPESKPTHHHHRRPSLLPHLNLHIHMPTLLSHPFNSTKTPPHTSPSAYRIPDYTTRVDEFVVLEEDEEEDGAPLCREAEIEAWKVKTGVVCVEGGEMGKGRRKTE
jgi:hypothetical protein